MDPWRKKAAHQAERLLLHFMHYRHFKLQYYMEYKRGNKLKHSPEKTEVLLVNALRCSKTEVSLSWTELHFPEGASS